MVEPFNMATAAAELNKQTDSSLASKSSRSQAPDPDPEPVIDPSSDKQNKVNVKCKHFSIRGYVSEVRKQDPRLCYPFSLKDSVEPLCTELPPMEVPNFRWCKCNACVPDKNGDASLARLGQFLKTVAARERNGEASTSTTDSNININNGHTNVDVDPKGKGETHENIDVDPKGKGKVHVDIDPELTSACDNGFLKDSTRGFLWQTPERMEVGPSSSKQVIELGSRCQGNGINKTPQKDSREHQIETGLAQESLNRNGDYANESSQEKSQDSSHDQFADSQTNVNGPRHDCKSRLLNLPDLNECSGEPLNEGNIEVVINTPISNDNNNNTLIIKNNDVDNEDDDDYLGAECRKNPKVRLLSELLGLKEIQISAKGRKKNISLASSLDENGKRKRVGAEEEGSKSKEMRFSDSGIKKFSQTTGSTTESASDYAFDSDDMSTEVISKTLAKRQCRSRIPLLEKKIKKSKVDNGGSSTYQPRIMSKSTANEKGKNSENMLPKSNVFDKLIKRSLVKTKKRGKLSQAGKDGNSLNPCKSQVPKDLTATQLDEKAEKRSNQKTQKCHKASENDLHLSRSLVNCQTCVAPAEHETCVASSQAELMLVGENSSTKHQENRNKDKEISVAFRSTALGTTSTGDSFDGDGERSFDPKTNLNDKKAETREAEEGSPLARDTCLQASSLVAIQKEQNKEVRGRRHDIDINSIPIDDKTTDDIPMDIVELMAKNQYERHLSDPKEMPLYPTTPDISRKFTRDNGIDGSYGEYWPKFGQSSLLTMPRQPSNTDSRNYMGHGNLGCLSDFNCNSLTSCRPRENTVSSRFLCPNQAQVQAPEHGASYPPYGLTLGTWNGNINTPAPQRYPPSFLHAPESYRLQAYASRQSTTEASRARPTVVTTRMPMGITNPQMISQSSSFLSMGNFGHHQTSGSILNFNNPGPTSLGNQQNLSFSNGYSNVGGHSESSGGSVGMYSDDAVSAMHLLSLMQNGRRMHNAANLSLGLPQKVEGPSSSRQPFVKDRSRSSAMLENARYQCYPTATAPVRPSVASFQNDRGNVGRNNNNGFVGPIPLTLRGQRNIESSHFSHPGGDHCPQRRHMSSPLQNAKDISAISPPSSVNPFQHTKDTNPNIRAGVVICDGRTKSSTPEKMICKLNQNPSEFNDLKVLSRYMIGPDDLRPRKKVRKISIQHRGDSNRQDFRLNKSNISLKIA